MGGTKKRASAALMLSLVSPFGPPVLPAEGFVSCTTTSFSVKAGQFASSCGTAAVSDKRTGKSRGNSDSNSNSNSKFTGFRCYQPQQQQEEEKEGMGRSVSVTAPCRNRLRRRRPRGGYGRHSGGSGSSGRRDWKCGACAMMSGPPGFVGGLLGGATGRGDGEEAAPEFKRHKRAVHRVIFMRHGESEWNRDNRFLGWADIGLTEDGKKEAQKTAMTLAEFGITVDEIFCSYLKRSIKTAWILADEMDQSWMPIHTDWRLNEQMYGALQGLNKRATAERFGTKLTQQWRRSYDIAPPAKPGGVGYFPPGDPKYAALTEDDIPSSWCGSPNTESLKDAQARSWLFWRERAVPAIKEGKTIMICGHGNIIRSMLKRLDNIPKSVLKQVSIPRATPLVYDLDEDLIPVGSPTSLGPLRGRFLCDPLTLARVLQQESLSAQLGPETGDGSAQYDEVTFGHTEGAVGSTAILSVPSPPSVEGSTEEYTPAMLP